MIDHPYLNRLRKQKVHLVGLASAEISAVANFLHSQGVKNLVAHDIYSGNEFKRAFRKAHRSLSKPEQIKALRQLESLPIQKKQGEDYLSGIEDADVIFPTQGWFLYKESREKLTALQDRGVEFGSMMKLYFELAPATIIGVTGTNGKGTTTHLIKEMLAADGKEVYLAGNDPGSVQVLDKLEKMKSSDYLVLEVSNRQLLIDLGKSPHIAVITNVTPNHLDEHHNLFSEYAEVKRSLLKYQTDDDFFVVNMDDETVVSFQEKSVAKKIGFSVFKKVENGAMIDREDIIFNDGGKKEVIAKTTDVRLPGDYNLENILAALVAAKVARVKNDSIAKVIKTFEGLPQRLQFVKEIDGVKYYNDLFSTTPASTKMAIESFSKPVILVAGGESKGVDYFDLAESIKEHVSKLWLFPGSMATDLKKHLSTLHFTEITEIDDFAACLEAVKKNARSGDIVLLSPGGAKFQSTFIGKKSKGYEQTIRAW